MYNARIQTSLEEKNTLKFWKGLKPNHTIILSRGCHGFSKLERDRNFTFSLPLFGSSSLSFFLLVFHSRRILAVAHVQPTHCRP